MRKLISTTLLSFLSICLFAQTTLTSQNNALIAGQSFTYSEIQFVEPGNNGANQIWDFSKIQFTEKNTITAFTPPASQKLEGLGNFNLTVQDDGYNFFMNSSATQLDELGYVNEEKKMQLVYSDPILKMKYPFAYGNQFTDQFAGVAFHNKDYRIDLTGENSVSADAYGTLMMPDMVIKNALRVKSVKNSIQVNMCGHVKVKVTKYAWYAEGYRYPVMVITIAENTYPNSLTPEIVKTAVVCTPQLNFNVNNDIPGNTNTSIANNKAEVSVVLFPNPFTEKITYNYFLKTEMPVTITLYDITGKYTELIANNETQSAGMHIGQIGGSKSNLAAGVYYLRFNFGEQVVVQKFVKLEAQ